jgi:GDP-L-fucose synthase
MKEYVELDEKRIVVTGGYGFLGGHVVEQLRAQGCNSVFPVARGQFDLTKSADVERMYDTLRPQVLIHLAAVVGGIEANRRRPAEFFYQNAIMGLQVVEAARRYALEKLVVVGTVCSYPKRCPTPFVEEDLWNGYPEETNAPYGLAKKMLLVQCQAYRRQCGLNAIYLIPDNLYGPGDNFEMDTSHVIPALLRGFLEAGRSGVDHVVCWGDGSATREFLYVEDAAIGIVAATRIYNDGEPVNLGSGHEISIEDLAVLIADLTGYRGRILWDKSPRNGQPKRCLNTSRAQRWLGFRASTALRDGLLKTIEWYKAKTSAAEERRGPA